MVIPSTDKLEYENSLLMFWPLGTFSFIGEYILHPISHTIHNFIILFYNITKLVLISTLIHWFINIYRISHFFVKYLIANINSYLNEREDLKALKPLFQISDKIIMIIVCLINETFYTRQENSALFSTYAFRKNWALFFFDTSKSNSCQMYIKLEW